MYIVITGGAGFVGSNLIKLLLKKTNKKIISIDNYSSGTKKNHIKSKKVKYIKSDTKNISTVLKNPKKIHSLFHFGEFARIYQSFLKMNECISSNSVGTNAVFNYCLKNKIKLIYSATSASLGNKGNDKNLSPYAFTKAKNLELLENLKKWFNFKYEVVYFYNVYGHNQISKAFSNGSLKFRICNCFLAVYVCFSRLLIFNSKRYHRRWVKCHHANVGLADCGLEAVAHRLGTTVPTHLHLLLLLLC